MVKHFPFTQCVDMTGSSTKGANIDFLTLCCRLSLNHVLSFSSDF